MHIGPFMIDFTGTQLTDADRKLLLHPLVGGVILFSHNYESPQQLTALTSEIHALRKPPLLIAVDHEGGRVQRFREHFVHIPAAQTFGLLYKKDPKSALEKVQQAGWLLAAELRAVGVDFSFAPVLDLNNPISSVINDRAYHHHPEVVAKLARAAMKGMKQAGMIAVGKHFPGHGSVAADSHHSLPVDTRPEADIRSADWVAFERMINYGLPALMPAHIVYSAVDTYPAGFSAQWLQIRLRKELGFQGAIFSDDLNMAGANVAGTPLQRAQQALGAGCDMALICNNRPAVLEVLAQFGEYTAPASQLRLSRLHGFADENNKIRDWQSLHQSQDWQLANQVMQLLETEPELNLGDDGLS